MQEYRNRNIEMRSWNWNWRKIYCDCEHDCLNFSAYIILCPAQSLLWSPYGIGQTIIFLPCGFFMAALRSRCGHYFCPVVSILFSSPNRSWQNSLRGQEPQKCIYSTSPWDCQTSCKVLLTSIERRLCSNEAETRNPLKFAGVPQTRQHISAVSGPKFTIL